MVVYYRKGQHVLTFFVFVSDKKRLISQGVTGGFEGLGIQDAVGEDFLTVDKDALDAK